MREERSANMCSICNLTPCISGCPNYGYKHFGEHKCELCRETIYETEPYFNLKSKYYHTDCLYDNMTTMELLSCLRIKPLVNSVGGERYELS